MNKIINYKIIVSVAILTFIGFIFGTTWSFEYRKPYYEAPGYIKIQQKLLNIEYIYCWWDDGFAEKNHPDWDIRKINREITQ